MNRVAVELLPFVRFNGALPSAATVVLYIRCTSAKEGAYDRHPRLQERKFASGPHRPSELAYERNDIDVEI